MKNKKLFFLILILSLSFVLKTSHSYAQNFTFFKELSCPDIGKERLALDMQYLKEMSLQYQAYPKNFMSRCKYEDSSYFSVFWSENKENQKTICSAPWYADATHRSKDYIFQRPESSNKIGLGVELSKVKPEDHFATVVNVIPNSSADKNGVQKNDRIIAINKTSIMGKTLPDVIQLTKGQKGRKVTLFINRKGLKKHLKIKVPIDEYRLRVIQFSVISPTHFAQVRGSFLNNPNTLEEDLLMGKEKAIELLHQVESLAVQCHAPITTNKGPIAR